MRSPNLWLAAAAALLLAACVDDTPQVSPLACTQCGTACVDLKTDSLHCGSCDKACAGGEICQASACVAVCPVGTVRCGGSCVDPATNASFCGASGDCAGANAGLACPEGESCVSGACTLACAKGQVRCGGACVDPKTDRAFCGAKLDCEGAHAGTACADDRLCVSGACTCPDGQLDCEGACTDPMTSTAHCGAEDPCTDEYAGVACGENEACVEGACQPVCGEGLVTCGGRCFDPLYDDDFCGAQADCSGGAVCRGLDRCVAGQCQPVFATCDELAAWGRKSCTVYFDSNYASADLSMAACESYCAGRGLAASAVVASGSTDGCGNNICLAVADFDSCFVSFQGYNCGTCNESVACSCVADGERTLYLDGLPRQPYQAWCADLATSPKTYLPLRNIGGDSNFAQYTAGGAMPGTSVRTSYQRLRFNPATRMVDIGDRTFAVTSGALAGIDSMPYGTAAGCEAGLASGLANVDLTGLPFKVVSTWSAGGTDAVGGATYSAEGRVWDVTGGGNCGWYNPGSPLSTPNASGSLEKLQLSYSPVTP